MRAHREWDRGNNEAVACLLAEAGATVGDVRGDAQRQLRGAPLRASVLDQATSGLLADPHAKGLLYQTMLVLATDSGRTPHINDNDGRDQHHEAFPCLLAGAGIWGWDAQTQNS